MKTLLLSVLSLVFAVQVEAATKPFTMPAKGLQICLDSSGNLSAKVKCKKGEVRATSDNIQAQCRIVTGKKEDTSGVATVDALCNSGGAFS